MDRGLTLEINLKAANNNINVIRNAAGNLPVIAVVKANAYGHGARKMAAFFEAAGVFALAVAFSSEAKELREEGIKLPILVLFDRNDIDSFFRYNLTPVIHDLKTAERLSTEASARNVTLDVHLKVDTGMGRMGLERTEDINKIIGLGNLKITGLMSHFADADLADSDYMRLQLERFAMTARIFHEKGLRPFCHMANSAALFSFKDAHMDAVRPGLALYGCSPFADGRAGAVEMLKPVMRAKTMVLAIKRYGKGQPISYGRTFVTKRDTTAAVLAAGYADGYIRAMSNKAQVLIKGKRAPVLGRVCMDLAVADITDIAGVNEFDDAVLMGRDGGDAIMPWEIAGWASTIPYEIMTSFGRNCTKIIYNEREAP